jgi:sugar lactone lactonase YvrE
MQLELGEGALWDEERATLYWLDILAGRVYRARLESGRPSSDARSEWCAPSSRIGALALGRDGLLVGALAEGIGLFRFGETPRIIAPPSLDPKIAVYNDGKVGPDGRFWVGYKDVHHASPVGILESVGADGSVRTLVRGLAISNGLGWSPDHSTFYLTDSIPRAIRRYRYAAGCIAAAAAPAEGALFERGDPFADAGSAPEIPDGLAVDAEGCLWSARWRGSCVVRYDASGRAIDRIDLPASRVSSCCFGGDDLRTLYITTAREDMDAAEREAEPLAGSVFAARCSVAGLPAFRFPA